MLRILNIYIKHLLATCFKCKNCCDLLQSHKPINIINGGKLCKTIHLILYPFVFFLTSFWPEISNRQWWFRITNLVVSMHWWGYFFDFPLAFLNNLETWEEYWNTGIFIYSVYFNCNSVKNIGQDLTFSPNNFKKDIFIELYKIAFV